VKHSRAHLSSGKKHSASLGHQTSIAPRNCSRQRPNWADFRRASLSVRITMLSRVEVERLCPTGYRRVTSAQRPTLDPSVDSRSMRDLAQKSSRDTLRPVSCSPQRAVQCDPSRFVSCTFSAMNRHSNPCHDAFDGQRRFIRSILYDYIALIKYFHCVSR
jgi:hypothetical protein